MQALVSEGMSEIRHRLLVSNASNATVVLH